MRVRRRRAVRIVAAALLVPAAAAAQPGSQPTEAVHGQVEQLRQELEALRRQYDARLAAVEAQIKALEGRSGAAVAPAAQADVPAGAAGAGGPTGSLPVYGSVSLLSKVFNPDIAVIGNFLGAAGTNEVDPRPALQLEEAEASLQAIVDPYARADFFFALGPEGVEVEEGFVTFPTLPGGLLVKAGKMRAEFGKVNRQHRHQLLWVDRPLVTTNLVGGEEGISDSGVSVSRLLLNPWFFLEATGEVYLGDSAVFATHSRDNLTSVGRLRGYQDLTESTNLDLGASVAFGRNELGPEFTTRLIGIDGTFRYRPPSRAIYRRFLARTELVWSRREQEGGTGSAFGAYATGEYQFARRWFGGGRLDYAERAVDPSLSDRGASLFVTFWPSEFGQLRGQYRRIRYGEGRVGNEFLFQVQFSIGAHGAHVF